MAKYFRSDVVFIKWPAGKDKDGNLLKDKDGNLLVKGRPVVVLQNQNKNPDIITVYCTSQNDGDDKNCIFVPFESEEGKTMGLEKDTYIRPTIIKTFNIDMVLRPAGKCPLMDKIEKIMDINRSK